MIVDLDYMNYRTAIDLIYWCVSNDIDRVKAEILAEALHTTPVPQVTWQLEVPEKYVPWLSLKFGLKVDSDECVRD